MTTEFELNAPPSTAEKASAAEYVPMPESLTAPPEEPKKKEFNAEREGIEAAAREVTEAREATEPEPVDRSYRNLRTLEKVPDNQTLTPERAAHDLTLIRDYEVASQQPAVEEVANAIDQVRAQNNGQQPQPHPEAQPQQHDQAQPVDGIDPDIAQALQNPKIRAALEAEVQAAESARQQFAQQALDAARLSAASLFSFAPELASLTTEQLPGALA